MKRKKICIFYAGNIRLEAWGMARAERDRRLHFLLRSMHLLVAQQQQRQEPRSDSHRGEALLLLLL